jgi:hypothetical protein
MIEPCSIRLAVLSRYVYPGSSLLKYNVSMPCCRSHCDHDLQSSKFMIPKRIRTVQELCGKTGGVEW